MEYPQDAQHHQQARQCSPAPVPRGGEVADQFGAEQHDDPGQVDPQQKQRHRGEGAIDQLVAREEAHIEAEQRLGRLEQQGGEGPPRQCMA
ncbi:hypothetical protein D3C80_1944300 [compost metagenome]